MSDRDTIPPGMTDDDMRRWFRIQEEERARRGTVGGVSDPAKLDTKDLQKNINFIDKAFGDLGKGLSTTIANLNYGQQGLASLNYTIQGAEGFLNGFSAMLAKTSPLLAGVLGGATGALSSYVQAVNLATDSQYAAYQALSKVGAADQFTGLTQVTQFADKLGYVGREGLQKFANLVTDSAESLARLGGTVEGGLKQFVALGTAIQKTAISTELARMGFDTDQQNKALSGLIKTITATGGSLVTLGKTSEQQAQSVKNYIKQQDEVTRLTGLTAEAQGKAYEQALQNDRFALEEYKLTRALTKAQNAPDAETAQGKARIEALQAAQGNSKFLSALPKLLGSEIGKGIIDFSESKTGAVTSTEAANFFQISSQTTRDLALRLNNPASQEEARKIQDQFLISFQNDLNRALEKFGGDRERAGLLNFTSPDFLKNIGGFTSFLSMDIPAAREALKTQVTDLTGKKPSATEADLANVVGIRQNLAELNSAIQKFINEGIGPVTNQILGFTEELRTKGKSISDFLKIPDNLTKEQRARYDAETGAGSSVQDIFKGRSEAFERNKEALRETTKAGIETVTTNIVDPIVNTFKEAGKGAADALDDVTKTLKRSLDGLGDMLRNWNRTVPLPPTSGVSFNSSSMSRLLNEYRAAAGPENRFEPSLVDAVYRPDVTNRENQPLADFRDEAGQASSAQIAAYETMIRQQNELIGLLERSVGIQDRTLRATYNA